MHVQGIHQFLFVAGLLTVHYLPEALIRDEDIKALSLQGQYECIALAGFHTIAQNSIKLSTLLICISDSKSSKSKAMSIF